jgi:cytochrome c-type biogenesis protein CcmH/NrfG
VVLLAAVCLSALPAVAEQPSQARAIARAAFELIEEHPFEHARLRQAMAEIDRARALDPDESYVFLAAALLLKAAGYHSGDRFEERSFSPELLEKSIELTERAVKADEKNVDAHVELASLYVAQRRFPEAQHHFFVAYKLAPEDFDVWYGQAVAWWKQGNAQKSHTALAGAEKRVRTDHDRITLLRQKERVARSRNNWPEVEAILEEEIRLTPDSPWAHGNYAGFLLRQRRYDEAVAEYEKAVKLGPYPIAERGLQEAKKRRDAARR